MNFKPKANGLEQEQETLKLSGAEIAVGIFICRIWFALLELSQKKRLFLGM